MTEPIIANTETAPEVRPEDRRWSWVEVNLDAIRYNVATAKRLVGSRRLMCVVKANGYGHGAVEVAKASLANGAEYLAVATVNEAIELRQAGIDAPILVLSQPPETTIPLLLFYKIQPAVYTSEFLLQYAEEADRQGLVAPFHLAVNTGMNRIGVRWDEVADFMRAMNFHRAVNLVGTFTHFATADEARSMDYYTQVKRFGEAISALQDADIDPGIVHCANTAATLRFPEVHCDMVRFGVGVYGLHPSQETERFVELQPAMSVKARITDVRVPVVGDGVSYGLTYRSAGNTYICTIPLGYADGLSRNLSGKIDVLWNGHRCKQVGRICMDQCMFEVDAAAAGGGALEGSTFAPQIGDEVVIIGSQGAETITLDEMAAKRGTIHYEVACDFSLRMPKIYV